MIANHVQIDSIVWMQSDATYLAKLVYITFMDWFSDGESHRYLDVFINQLIPGAEWDSVLAGYQLISIDISKRGIQFRCSMVGMNRCSMVGMNLAAFQIIETNTDQYCSHISHATTISWILFHPVPASFCWSVSNQKYILHDLKNG